MHPGMLGVVYSGCCGSGCFCRSSGSGWGCGCCCFCFFGSFSFLVGSCSLFRAFFVSGVSGWATCLGALKSLVPAHMSAIAVIAPAKFAMFTWVMGLCQTKIS